MKKVKQTVGRYIARVDASLSEFLERAQRCRDDRGFFSRVHAGDVLRGSWVAFDVHGRYRHTGRLALMFPKASRREDLPRPGQMVHVIVGVHVEPRVRLPDGRWGERPPEEGEPVAHRRSDYLTILPCVERPEDTGLWLWVWQSRWEDGIRAVCPLESVWADQRTATWGDGDRSGLLVVTGIGPMPPSPTEEVA